MTTVLLVDNSTANRRLLYTLLSLKGLDVIEADNGGQALDIARREHPEIVVADVFAPRAGGQALVREMREDPRIADIPVVAYGCDDTGELGSIAEKYRVDRVVAGASDPGPLLEAIDSLIIVGTPRTGGRAGAEQPDGVRSRLALELAPVGIAIGAVSGEASYVNPALAALAGLPRAELLGTGWLSCLSPQRRRQALDAIAAVEAPPGSEGGTADRPASYYRDCVDRPDHEPQLLDVYLRHTPGSNVEPRGFVAFLVDVTPTVRGEELRHAEWERHLRDDSERAATRMESLRRFAGSVAHGYNNALAVILSYGEFMRDRIGEAGARGRIDPATAHDLNADLTSILDAGRRAAHLTQQLQSFGHRGRPPAPMVVGDLNASLRPKINTLAERVGAGFRVHIDLAEGLRPVVADPEQIGEIISNLTENALDAMPTGGELRIETAPGDPDRGPARLAADGYVRLTVRDTGHGMPPHVAQHAIEPFFTTKPDSPGGGLGLTAVYGIARQAGGEVLIESVPDSGTSVHVLFPVAAATGARPPETGADAAVITETILVVDDEEPVRRMVHRILTKAGYQVLMAEDATQALELARSQPGPVHCLISDLAMPGLPGTELTRRLRAERPELAVLYMSGYAEPLLHHVGNADNRTNLLPKPFSRAELLTAVRATIHEHRTLHRGTRA